MSTLVRTQHLPSATGPAHHLGRCRTRVALLAGERQTGLACPTLVAGQAASWPGSGSSSARWARSPALRAGVEHGAVEVHVELDRAEPVRGRIDPPAEGSELPLGRTAPARAADESVLLVFGLADPLA